jgi:hypothetical protein
VLNKEFREQIEQILKEVEQEKKLLKEKKDAKSKRIQ